MSIKHILVPLTGVKTSDNATLCAFELATALNAHVTVCGTPIPPGYYFVPETAVLPGGYAQFYETLKDIEVARQQRARKAFDAAVALTKMHIVDTPRCAQASAVWLDSATVDGKGIPALSRLADLIVIDQPTPSAGATSMQVFEDAVFDAHRPALLVPSAPTDFRFRRATIGWNGSTETVTAVERALGLLGPGAEITIVQIGDIREGRASAEEVSDYLGWHGFEAKIRLVADKPGATGALLLSEAKAAHADFLIVGAYSHSRMRELVLGGVTRYLLEHATLPLFMAH